jgi:hypothetical protein|tara:strand:- start:379 stop:828 length:450 start_codon:yes stop_codon:yes gene_type:complete
MAKSTSGTAKKLARGTRKQKRQAAFLEALTEHANVSLAAGTAKVPRKTVYNWRQQDEKFRDAWDEAWEIGVDAMEEEAWRRGVQGVDKGIYHNGKKVAVERQYSDNLLMFMLKARRPKKFRDNSMVEHTGVGGEALVFRVSFVDAPKGE